MSAGRKEALTVGDLFCGAGGFAEGFEQAGFRVAWGVDNWHPAVETFQKNHPRATVLEKDLLSLDPAELTRLGKVDVLIGSPPCTHFSAANKGGNGDRRAGMLLVQRFLTFVQALKPRYWVMENVPGLQKDLDPVVREGHIQLDDGPLKIPAREVLDSAEFGAPQSRRRLYSGSFPLPSPVASYSEGNVPKLRSILETLPNPREDVGASRAAVHDPVYDREKVPRASLRDHFEDTRWALTQDEVDSSIRERETHRIYGKMPFPDSPDRPCRTVTATRTRGSRSTIVIPYPDRKEVPYRTLTLRECASAQGFPLAYQFWATSMSDKDALVGNAVTPPVARAIANAILLAEDREPAATPAVKQVGVLPPIVTVRRIGPKRFSMTRRFRGIVPVDWAHEHRVELDNEFPRPSAGVDAGEVPSVSWKTRLYLGYATEYRCYDLTLASSLRLARSVLRRPRLDSLSPRLCSTLIPLMQTCLNGFLDAVQLQERWTGRRIDGQTPYGILQSVASYVGRGLPKSEWGNANVPIGATNPVLEPLCIVHGKEADSSQPLPMSVRLFASTLALTIVCERLNQGTGHLDLVNRALLSRDGFESSLLDGITAQRFTSGPRSPAVPAR